MEIIHFMQNYYFVVCIGLIHWGVHLVGVHEGIVRKAIIEIIQSLEAEKEFNLRRSFFFLFPELSECQPNLLEEMDMFGKEVSKEKACCTGCDNLMKEIAVRDKLIYELQLKLRNIHETSASRTCTASVRTKEDLNRKFDLTSFILGMDVPLWVGTPSFSSGETPVINQTKLSNGSVNGFRPQPSSPSFSQIFQRKGDTAGYSQQESRHEVRTIRFQEIIDKAVDESPKKGKVGFIKQESLHEERVITVQEIINNIVDKSRNREQSESCKMGHLENMCDCCNKLLSRLESERKESRNGISVSHEEEECSSSSSCNSQESCSSSSSSSSYLSKDPPKPFWNSSSHATCSSSMEISSVTTAELEGNYVTANVPTMTNNKSPHRNRYLFWRQHHLENHHKLKMKTSSSKHRPLRFLHYH